MLEVSGLCVRYGAISAVRNVSLTVACGELVALIGANGAGKSSILNAIAGLVRFQSGEVTIDGKRAASTPERLAQDGLSLVPEGRRIFGSLTVEENLRMGHSRSGKVRDFAAARERTLKIFPILRDYLSQPAARLSGGQQQQLAIARALLTKPQLLLLDEPSLGLDPLMTDVIFDAIEDLRSNGMSILLVEQNALRAIDAADRTYAIRGGVVTHLGHKSSEHLSTYMRDSYFISASSRST